MLHSPLGQDVRSAARTGSRPGTASPAEPPSSQDRARKGPRRNASCVSRDQTFQRPPPGAPGSPRSPPHPPPTPRELTPGAEGRQGSGLAPTPAVSHLLRRRSRFLPRRSDRRPRSAASPGRPGSRPSSRLQSTGPAAAAAAAMETRRFRFRRARTLLTAALADTGRGRGRHRCASGARGAGAAG